MCPFPRGDNSEIQNHLLTIFRNSPYPEQQGKCHPTTISSVLYVHVQWTNPMGNLQLVLEKVYINKIDQILVYRHRKPMYLFHGGYMYEFNSVHSSFENHWFILSKNNSKQSQGRIISWNVIYLQIFTNTHKSSTCIFFRTYIWICRWLSSGEIFLT